MVLQAPVATEAVAGLWHASQGNPLFLRELVRDAAERGVLQEIDGVWQLTGELVPGPRLLDFIETRLRDLDPASRAVLHRVALCGPLSYSRLEGLHDLLPSLEERGFLSVRADVGGLQVEVSHPLHRQALRRLLPVSRRARILLDEAVRLESDGALSDADVTRLASWRVEAGVPLAADLVRQAARLARFAYDFATVERLTAADCPDLETATLRCEALYLLNRHDEALALATTWLMASEPTDPLRGRLFGTAMAVSFSGLAKLEDAVTLAVAAGDAPEVVAMLACVYGFAGHSRLAAALSVDAAVGGRMAMLAGVSDALAALAAGRTEVALKAVDNAWAALVVLGPDAVGLPNPLVLDSLHMAALVEGGRFDEAQSFAHKVIDGVTAGRGQIAMPG